MDCLYSFIVCRQSRIEINVDNADQRLDPLPSGG